ncbi:MAG: NAD(P)H-binding protein [Holophagaceae bacterium]|nr:NAD(P)H-binding protein [Holophagaceae bacterium]
MTQHVVIAGGSGEVGRQLLALLAQRPELSLRALVRQLGSLPASANLEEVPFDFEDSAAYGPLFARPCDLLLIALGTTRAKAGSAEAFLRVDRDYPMRLISALATTHPGAKVGLVSSVGADRGKGLYLGAKATVEAELAASGLSHAIVRPSFLRSDRREFRLLEVLVNRLIAPPWLALGRMAFSSSPAWWRWAPVHVREVAATLLEATLSLKPGQRRVLEGLDLHPGPASRWGKP